jgi:hypothetical protein
LSNPLLEEEPVDLPGDRALGLELPDPAFGRGQLDRLINAQAFELAA